MAPAVPAAHSMENRSTGAQSRRLELEKEVAELAKVLLEEKRLHHILECALIPQNTRATLHIPSFLPKRTKELLAELFTVEEEIARLESEVNKIRGGLSEKRGGRQHEKNPNVYVHEHRKPSALELPANLLLSSSHVPCGKLLQNIAPGTKSMFYINQAIRGDYLADDFFSKGSTGSLIVSDDYRDESQSAFTIIENVSRKSARTLKASSPMLPAKQHVSSKDTSLFMMSS